MVYRDVEDQLFWLPAQSPDEFGPFAARARAQDLYRPVVHPPRGLLSRTREILEIPRYSVEVQNCAGSGVPSVWQRRVKGKYLSLGMRFEIQRKILGVGVSECGASGIHLPYPERLTEAACNQERRPQKNSHASQCVGSH